MKFKHCIFFCVLLFLLLSFVLNMQVKSVVQHFDIDSFGYHALAQKFSQLSTFFSENSSSRAPVQPIGYPLFIGMIYKLFGESIEIIVVMQIGLTVCSLVILMLLAHMLFGSAVAVVTGFLAAVNIGFLTYAQCVLAESLLLFFLLLFAYFFVWFSVSDSLRAVCLAGAILGLSTIIKPTAFGLLILLVPVVLYTLRSHWYSMLKGAICFILFFSLPVFIYMWRNYYLYGHFSFAPMMPLNMYQCLLAKVIGDIENIPVQEVIDTQLRFTATNSFDPAGWERARGLFYHYLHKHPFTFMYIWLENVAKTLCGLFSTQLKLLIEPHMHGGDCSFFAQRTGVLDALFAYIQGGVTHGWLLCVVYIEAIWSVVRVLLVIMGLWFLCVEKKYGLVTIFVVCIMLLSLITGMDGCCRYRITFEPILIMITAYAVVKICSLDKRRWCI